jgi:hypothetical protein
MLTTTHVSVGTALEPGETRFGCTRAKELTTYSFGRQKVEMTVLPTGSASFISAHECWGRERVIE